MTSARAFVFRCYTQILLHPPDGVPDVFLERFGGDSAFAHEVYRIAFDSVLCFGDLDHVRILPPSRVAVDDYDGGLFLLPITTARGNMVVPIIKASTEYPVNHLPLLFRLYPENPGTL